MQPHLQPPNFWRIPFAWPTSSPIMTVPPPTPPPAAQVTAPTSRGGNPSSFLHSSNPLTCLWPQLLLSHKTLAILPFSLSEAKPSSVLTSHHFLPFRKPYIINHSCFLFTINLSFLFLYCHLNMRKSPPSFHIPCSFFSGSNSLSPPQFFLHLNKSGKVFYAYQQEDLFNEPIGSCNFSL